MNSWTDGKRWSDQFVDQIKGIVGPLLFEQSSLYVDRNEATDLVLRVRDLRIACRMRSWPYAAKYPYQFTMRAFTRNGALSEHQKFVDGFGDWMFYGYASERGDGIGRYVVIDLKAWRSQRITYRIAGDRHANGDGTGLLAYDLRHFYAEPPLVVACSHPEIRVCYRYRPMGDLFADQA